MHGFKSYNSCTWLSNTLLWFWALAIKFQSVLNHFLVSTLAPRTCGKVLQLACSTSHIIPWIFVCPTSRCPSQSSLQLMHYDGSYTWCPWLSKPCYKNVLVGLKMLWQLHITELVKLSLCMSQEKILRMNLWWCGIVYKFVYFESCTCTTSFACSSTFPIQHVTTNSQYCANAIAAIK